MATLADLMNQDRRAKLAREMTNTGQFNNEAIRAQSWRDVANAPGQLAQGMFTGIAGSPVEIANMALRPLGLGSDRPVGGMTSLASLIRADEGSVPYQAGTMLPIGPEGLAIGGAKLAGLAGIFAGRGAKTANLAALTKAEQLKAAAPEPLFDTIGLPNRGRELIQSKAEEYAQRLRDAGVNVIDVQHSGSAAGPSSYIKVQGYPDIRISGHSKGVFGSTGVVNVGNDAALEDVLAKIPKTARRASSEEVAQVLAKQKEEEIATMYPIRIKSAQKKLAKGKSLTHSEQEAMDWLKNQPEYQ